MDTTSSHDHDSSNPNAHTYTYTSPRPIYAVAFSHSPSSSSSSSHTLLAVGSFLEDLSNRVDLVSFDEESLSFLPPDPSLSFDHPYPPTKLLFSPSSPHSLLASSGDYLRIWQIDDSPSSVRLLSLLDNSKTTEYCAPLTSFDWNPSDPRLIATSSIDTTCTVWDVNRSAVETQLIAHDKEVYDVAWGESRIFASVSADASVRVFDLRNKEHSTIIYDADAPLLRLAWNRNDLRYIAAIALDSSRIAVLDIRSPGAPVAELQRHRGSVNAVAWAPHSTRLLCSAGDDGEALIWHLPPVVSPPASGAPERGIDPILAYTAGSEVNQLQWSAAHPGWIGIAFSNKLQLLKV